MKITHRILPGLLLLAPMLRAQTPAVAAAPVPSCAEDLEFMKGKLEANYAGFLLEVKPHRAAYDSAVGTFRDDARRVAAGDCFFVLRAYLAWFHDPHLFVYQTSRLDTAETTRRAGAVEMRELDEPAARAYFQKNVTRLDPIEGIWYDGALRVAIVPEKRDEHRGPFVAVVVQSDTGIWRAGAVRGRFVRHADGSYDADLSLRNFGVRHLEGRIHKHVLLRLSPEIWGKAFPLAARDSGLVDSGNPRRPTFVSRDGALVVSIPSHDPSYKPAFDSLIARHSDELRAADRLIVDLRGNEGGSSFMSNAILPFIASNPRRAASSVPFDSSVVLSSPDQIQYFRSAFGPETVPGNRRRLDRMRGHEGELVPLFDSLDNVKGESRDSVIVGPRRVGILTDGGTVSASEVLVLSGLKSTRTTVFGEPTEGALDYQSTYIVPISPRERRWFLGYPTITASDKLPTGGMRGKGIQPDVRLNLAKIPDPVKTVSEALRR